MSVSHCQLSLPFSSIQRLVESQQYKLLVCQSRRIEVHEWEITALQSICEKKGWITKGIAIVHKYAGCIDEIQQCFSRLNQSIDLLRELSQRIDSSTGNDNGNSSSNGDGNAVLEEVLMISVVFLRLYYTICQWRKLQWMPRPIVIEEDGSVYSVAEYVAMKLNQVAAALMHLADAHLKVLRKVPVELFTILFSPIQMYEGIGELHSRLSTGGTSLSSTLASNIGNYSSSSSSSSMLQDIAKMVIDVFNMEDLIDEKWKDIHHHVHHNKANNSRHVNSGTTEDNNHITSSSNRNGNDNESSSLLATLCIPYPELKNSSISVKWFVSSFPSYDRNIKLLRNLIQLLLDSYPRIKASDILSDGLVSLVDEKKSTMRWSMSSQQTISITNQLVLQSLVPIVFKSPIVTTSNLFPTRQDDEREFMEIITPSPNNRNHNHNIVSCPPTSIGFHPLSPVHSISKDSNASTTIEGVSDPPLRLKVPPPLPVSVLIVLSENLID